MKNEKKITKLNKEIAKAILLNYTFQSVRSPARKTLQQIADKFKVDKKKVEQINFIVNNQLINKINVIQILLEIG